MKLRKFFALSALALSVSACASIDTASRNAPVDSPVVGLAETISVKPSFDVTSLNISVPRDLRVSEANMYYPIADIVWRGDIPGDRHNQVGRIFQTGMGEAPTLFNGEQDVKVFVEVLRFHSLTEKARYTVGGVHSIKFALSVVDANTGEILINNRVVKADLEAFGGYRALEAERLGATQKVRISQHLGEVLARELTRPLIVAPGSTAAIAGQRV